MKLAFAKRAYDNAWGSGIYFQHCWFGPVEIADEVPSGLGQWHEGGVVSAPAFLDEVQLCPLLFCVINLEGYPSIGFRVDGVDKKRAVSVGERGTLGVWGQVERIDGATMAPGVDEDPHEVVADWVGGEVWLCDQRFCH